MIDPGLERELVQLLRDLPADQQQRVLELARALVFAARHARQERPAPPNKADEEARRTAGAASDDRADLLDW